MIDQRTTESGRPGGDAVRTGRKIQSYDFRRPSRFSRDHLRALQKIHETFGRNVGSAFSSYLRLNVRAKVTAVEQAAFDEYIEQLANPTVVYVVRLPTLPGPMLLEIANAPTHAILDRLCGGSGAVSDPAGQLTELEQALLAPLGRNLLRALSEAWSRVVRFNPAIEDTVLNPQAVRAIAPNEIVAVVGLEIAVGDVVGTMSLCLPHLTVEPIMERLHAQGWIGGQDHAEQTMVEQAIEASLHTVALDVSVELGQIELPATDLLSLAVGDVIRLDTPTSGDLKLRIAGRDLFRCKPGVSAGNIAAQITA